MEGLATGGEDGHAWTGREERGDIRSGRKDTLAIVEDE